MEETKTYELGFLLTPLLTEEVAAGFLTSAFKQLFERHEAAITATEAPKMIPLAYTIRKRIENKNQVFKEAYFGALRFTAAPLAIPAITAELRKMNEVIRSLVIIIPKDAGDISAHHLPAATRTTTVPVADALASETPVAEVVAKVETSENKDKAIDKEIDDLLTSTTQ